MTQRSVLAISGDVRSPSRTCVLVAALAGAVAARLGSLARVLEVAKEGLPLLVAPTRAQLSRAGRELVAQIESADVLILGAPVFRGSYTGALRHVLDLLSPGLLAGTPILLAAAGSHPGGLVTEHRHRDLARLSGTLTAPTMVYAAEEDFTGYAVASPAVLGRIERAADEAAALLDVARGWSGLVGNEALAAVA
jgi:FMN reductase